MRTLTVFLTTFAFAMLPALVIRYTHMPVLGFVIGSAAVAAAITAMVTLARRRHVALQVALLLITCTLTPVLAGGVTGVAVGWLLHHTIEGAMETLDEAMFGTTLTFPFLAGATLVAWFVAVAAGALFDRFGPRARRVEGVKEPWAPVGG